uniref:BHLH domain-containing protein n=1 Tax=Ciona savignyi TaxID=51511 RepID=H2Y5J9_CIOSA
MAFYQKTLENVTNILTADYRQREREFSDASNSGATGSLVSTHSCLTGTTGPINLPTLAPIHGNEILVNVTDDIDIDPGVGGGGLYGQREQDRKVRREIANSNERRRMQSINAGFNSLKTILPHTDGDKLSKAAILQQTAEYILQLESDKLKLLNQNEKLRRAYSDCICAASKHKTLLYESLDKDEGIGSPREEDLEDVRRDAIEVRQQLDKERRLRMLLEDQVRDLESKIYPEKLRELAHTVASQHRSNNTLKLNFKTFHLFGHRVNDVKFSFISHVKLTLKHPQFTQETPVTTTAIITSPPRLQSPIRYQVQPKLPPLQTAVETEVPHPGVCVTVENTEEVPHMLAQSKYCGSIPRSRQPLKKRAVELTEPDQTAPCKVAKVCAQAPSTKSQSTNPPVKSVKVVSLKAPDISPTPKPEPQVVFPTPAQNRTYMTLTQPGKTQIWQEPKTATQNFQITVTNTPPQIAGSQYVIQPNIQMSQPKQEITLNQLNNVSSLSMTLTQLNALSTACTRASIIPVHQTTGSRVQAQYLPLVAMDTVLGRHSERRISSATTDSVVSDEEKREISDETLPAPVSRSKSDPGPVLPIDGHPGPSADGNTGSPASDGIACNSPAATVSVLSNGPGSPPMIRRIDAVATRRNLETIVQAIDHLEQQERRNSQDHQHSDESAT